MLLSPADSSVVGTYRKISITGPGVYRRIITIQEDGGGPLLEATSARKVCSKGRHLEMLVSRSP